MPEAEKVTYEDINRERKRLSEHLLSSINVLAKVLDFPSDIAHVALHVLFTYPYLEMSKISDPKGLDVDKWYNQAEFLFFVGLMHSTDLPVADILFYTYEFGNISRFQTSESIEIARGILGQKPNKGD